MNDFITGMKYIFTGIRLLARPGVRMYVIIPVFFNAIIFAGIIFLGANQIAVLNDYLAEQWAWVEWFSWLLWPLFVVISLLIIFFLFTPLVTLIAAPFNGFLAQAVERTLDGDRVAHEENASSLVQEIVSAIKSELIKFGYFLIRALPLLILFFIPFIQAIAPLMWFLFGAWMISLEYLEIPMGNHKKLFPEVRETVRENRTLAIGFGAATMAMTAIPIINFIVMPAAVCGATSLWREKIKYDKNQIGHEESQI